MCNLYSVRTSKDKIRKLARVLGEMLDTVGNFETMPAIFPNRMAPVVRHLPGGARALTMMRWGFSPGFAIRSLPQWIWSHALGYQCP